jgi:hypothetical protein
VTIGIDRRSWTVIEAIGQRDPITMGRRVEQVLSSSWALILMKVGWFQSTCWSGAWSELI